MMCKTSFAIVDRPRPCPCHMHFHTEEHARRFGPVSETCNRVLCHERADVESVSQDLGGVETRIVSVGM